MRVLLVYDLFDSRRHENVALLIQHVLSFVGLGAGEAHYSSVVDPVVFQSLGTE